MPAAPMRNHKLRRFSRILLLLFLLVILLRLLLRLLGVGAAGEQLLHVIVLHRLGGLHQLARSRDAGDLLRAAGKEQHAELELRDDLARLLLENGILLEELMALCLANSDASHLFVLDGTKSEGQSR